MVEGQERLHAVVHGRVQGVSFRYYTQQTATIIGVTGWVRNKEDRTVEVLAEGPRKKLEELLKFLHQGPPAAHVINVEVHWLAATGEFDEFEIRY